MSQKSVYELREGRRSKPTLTSFDRFSALAFKIFGKQGAKFVSLLPSLKEEIIKSNMRITPEGLVSVALLTTTISAVITGALAVLGIALHFPILTVGVVFLPVILFLVLNAPTFSQSSRASALDNELPFLIGFMDVLAEGGVSAIAAMRRITRVSNIFPAAASEAKRILVDIDVFGMDPISAIEKAANHNPNRAFTEFFYGYTTVLKTGGDAVNYVNNKLKEIFERRSAKIKRTSDTIGTLAEAYMTVTAVLGISLFTLYQIQAVIAHNSSGITSLFIFSFLVVPLISFVFIWIMDGVQPKQPYRDIRPYKVFAAFIPAGIIVLLLPIPIQLYLHVSLALIAIVLVPSIVAMRYAREKAGLEKALPDFVRDVAEGRKIGLPPEGAIEALANKNYGRLSKSVRKMASQVSWGLTLDKVILTFTAEVRSWITKVVGTLMVEIVDVGGGTVKSFSEMADFTRKVNDIEADQKSALRPYIFVTYMAGLMLVVTTFLMVFLLSQPATLGAASKSLGLVQVDPATVQNLLVAAIFESWVVGIVAGKMGEGSVAAGFKHALILVVLSVVTVGVASLLVPTPV